ncbi:hypothetical protein [Helicobacter turcicus]|uniref:Lipoprotein n=1 Tax=Helicobacter turcicus TaxID=2867412 RepID=A0ABS7JPE6_9HELI|nr:hypothetical protein [Helicobacter turcicus]MBX7491240.1 hypothetical protein [Helicobacter turcicus]MBX7546121.1 hypothetical protein [Helicobacter turcicus]
MGKFSKAFLTAGKKHQGYATRAQNLISLDNYNAKHYNCNQDEFYGVHLSSFWGINFHHRAQPAVNTLSKLYQNFFHCKSAKPFWNINKIPKTLNFRYNSNKGLLLWRDIVTPLAVIFLVARTTRNVIVSNFKTLLKLSLIITLSLTFSACSSKVQTNKIPQSTKYHLPNTSITLKSSVDENTKRDFENTLNAFFKTNEKGELESNIYKVGIQRGHFK